AWAVSRALRSGKWTGLTGGLVASYVVVYLGFGLFTSAYFSTEGYAAADVAEYINANNLSISASIHNAVLTNSAYLVDEARFAGSGEAPIYETIAVGRNASVDGALYVRDVRVLGILIKRYAIVEY
ncbi:MAG: hypothetical protein QGF90_00875, partial [Gammaproteobacteria bacterium]|nr:hypothetical protein [Gammaproteobacteria bacterium]